MTNYVIDDCTGNLGPLSTNFPVVDPKKTINYILENTAWDASFTDLRGRDRGLKADIISRNVAFDPGRNNYNFDYKNINHLKKVEVTYSKTNGFLSFHIYKGTAYSTAASDDVTLKATFYNEEVDPPVTIEGSIGGSNGFTIGSTNFGNITFTAQGNGNGQFTSTNISFSNNNIRTEAGFNELKGSFRNDGSSSNFPSQVVGELKMKRFFDQSPDKDSSEYRSNLYLRGENAIAGIFYADRDNEVVKEHQTSSQTPSQSQTPSETQATLGDKITINDKVTTTLMGQFSPGPTGGGAFPFGLWASEKFLDNKIRFLTLATFLNPNTRPGNYVSHKTLNGDIRYEREDGFKGVYIYEGETGELTGDVELKLSFQSGYIQVDGNISSDLEIEGNDLGGIIIIHGEIDPTTGVGSYTPEGITTIGFGRLDLSDGASDLTTMHDKGQDKLRMVLSPDGRHGREALGGATVQPQAYPSYIAGEVEINGFKIKADDRDTNTLVGAFIGDKQEQ